MTGSGGVLLASCAFVQRDGSDDDEAPLLEALAAGGVTARPAVWDEAVDWGAAEAVVVRSTWDYAERRTEFLDWARRVAGETRLANPAPVLRWNTDKSYLGELAAAGIPVVPTTYVPPGGRAAVPRRGELVVKPTVSAGSKRTARYDVGDGRQRTRALAHIRRLHEAGDTAMLQPYIASVDVHGETALLFIEGTFSHAIQKGALLEPGAPPTTEPFAPETITAREPALDEHAVAAAALDAVQRRFGPLLYARVDLVRDSRGAPLVLEVEVTEPSMFLAHDPDAANRFARAITRLLRSPRVPA